MREPLEGLLDALEDEFGPAHLYRANRDVRFSKDKSPYKDHQGALATTVPGMGFYVQVNADGLMTGGGFYPTGPDQLPRLRAAIDAPRSGQDLQRVVDDLTAAGFELGGDAVATRPRGVPADHPRLELIRFKNLIAKREHGAPPWLSTPEVVDHVRADWARGAPARRLAHRARRRDHRAPHPLSQSAAAALRPAAAPGGCARPTGRRWAR